LEKIKRAVLEIKGKRGLIGRLGGGPKLCLMPVMGKSSAVVLRKRIAARKKK